MQSKRGPRCCCFLWLNHISDAYALVCMSMTVYMCVNFATRKLSLSSLPLSRKAAMLFDPNTKLKLPVTSIRSFFIYIYFLFV